LDDLVTDMLGNKNYLDIFLCESAFKGADSTKLSGMKVLFIDGERDKYITKAVTDRLAEKIGPDARKEYIKDASHITWLSPEGTKETVRVIGEWVKSCEATKMKK